MQIVLEDEVKGSNGRRTGAVGFVIHAEGISGCVKRKCNGRDRGRRSII